MTPTTTVSVLTCSRAIGLGTGLPATATGAAASALVNVDEIDAYVLAARERADHGTQGRRGTARAADDLAHIVRIDSNLEHPPATQFLVLDGDIVRMRDDASDEMVERVGEHLGPAGLRVGDTGIGSLLSLF